MNEYIELVKHLDKQERCKNCTHLSACDAWVRNATTLYDDYIYSVENCPYYQPTADVVEVRHGEWIDVPYPNNPNWEPRKRCSICGRFVRRKTENYCPDCGAKMDGKKEEKRTVPRCRKCVYEMCCSRDKDNGNTCPDYKRDPPDGGYYG